jgi:outer membrane protein assembly factor BamB
MSGMKQGKAWAALLLLVALMALAGCGSSDDSTSSEGDLKLTGDAWPGVDLASTRNADGKISRDNANSLQVAWKMPLDVQSSFGAMATTPVIANGVVYMQDLESNVYAASLESGEVQWKYTPGEPTLGPNGVVVADGQVFAATGSDAFALDQKTGKELWSTPLKDGPSSAIDMAPGYHDGLVYVSTVPATLSAEYPGGTVGTLYALDGKTGKVAWEWETVPKSLWGDKAENSGGGLWYPPSFDGKGFMYVGTGNPAPFPGTAEDPWGSSRPGPNLYTNSLVKLDEKTGKMQWYYQQTPHDVYDWDFQNSPILANVGGRELAIGSGKSGYVVAVDAKTGKVAWKRPLGIHNGHDRDGLLAMRGEYSKIKKTNEIMPGYLGGIIAPIAASDTTVYVPIVQHPGGVGKGQARTEGEAMFGLLVAVDIKTGEIEWFNEYETAVFGAPTVVNDMVFFTTFDGKVRGVDAKTGGEVWQQSLPATSNAGVAISGDTMVVPAGLAQGAGQKAAVVAYQLGGGKE